MSTTIKNVAWIGTGKTGLPLLSHLATTGVFNITLLHRSPILPTKNLPTSISTKLVDFTSHPTLVSALRSSKIDAVVVVATFGPNTGLDVLQLGLINAAIEAGVRFFIPSEWAPDTAGDSGPAYFGVSPVVAQKRAVHNYLLARAAEGRIWFAAVYGGVALEASGLRNFFNFQTKTASLADGGHFPVEATTHHTFGRAIASILSRPDQFKNRFLHVTDGIITQNDILREIEKVTGEKWTRRSFSSKEMKEQSHERIWRGTYGVKEFSGVLSNAFFGGFTVWNKVDNEELGIKEEERKDLREEVRRAVSELDAHYALKLLRTGARLRRRVEDTSEYSI